MTNTSKIIRVNHLEEVLDTLDFHPKSPFEKNLVVYQNAGVKDMVTFGIAERKGISANMEYITIHQLIKDLARSFDIPLPSTHLIWIIYKLFDADFVQDEKDLQAYIEDEVRKLQLAEKLAELFDDYYNYNQEQILLDGWQRKLWDYVISHHQEAFDGYLTDLVIEALNKPEAKPFMRELAIVGVDYFTPKHLGLVKVLQQNVPHFRLYYVLPEGVSGDSKVYQRKLETFQLLSEDAYEASERNVDTVLEAIQEVICTGVLPTGKSLDESLHVAAAPSKRREVEILYDHILYAMQNNGLKASDIFVFMPRVEEYRPYIEAVLDSGEYPVRIPYHITDIPNSSFEKKARLVLDSFKLETDRLTLKQVADFLEFKHVSTFYGIEDTEKAIQLLERTAFIRGNQDDESDLSLIAWPQSRKRLLYGATMVTDIVYDGVEPLNEVEGPNLTLALAVVQLVDDLFQFADQAEERDFSDWFNVYAERYSYWFQEKNDDIEAEELAIWDLFTGLHETSFTMSSKGFVYLTESQLSNYSKSGTRYSSGVVFGDLSSSRGMNRKMVAIIGLNDRSYPRKDVFYRFDALRDTNIRPTKREKDALDFHSALLSASERVYLSYIGRKATDNTELLPSIFLMDILEHLASLSGKSTDKVVAMHPTDAFDGTYAELTWPYFTFKELIKAKHIRELPQLDESPEFIDHQEILLTDLVQYYENPSKWYTRHVLGVSLYEDNSLVAESEVFDQDTLAQWIVRNDALNAVLGMGADDSNKQKQAGVLPLGGYGDSKKGLLLSEVKAVMVEATKLMAGSEIYELPKGILALEDKVCRYDAFQMRQPINGGKPYSILWSYKSKRAEVDEKIGKQLVALLFNHAVAAINGIETELILLFPASEEECQKVVFEIVDQTACLEWLSLLAKSYYSTSFERFLAFYPRFSFSAQAYDTAQMEEILHAKFDPGNERGYVDVYEGYAYGNTKAYQEELFKADWEGVNQQFWNIMKEVSHD